MTHDMREPVRDKASLAEGETTMTRRVVLVHTVPGLVPVFQDLATGLPGDVKVSNIVDESLLQDAIAAGGLTPAVSRRVVDHILSAADSGAVAVLATCSSIGPAVEIASQLVGVPVLRVDEPMASAAIESCTRIGVLATVASTLDPTVDLLRRRARDLGKDVELVPVLKVEAFDAIWSGDGARHDAIIAEAVVELAGDVDAIVLAQASMARVVATLAPGAVTVPVFSSPGSGMARLASVLDETAVAASKDRSDHGGRASRHEQERCSCVSS
jgi:Asp/Glu/hydantoin racemase